LFRGRRHGDKLAPLTKEIAAAGGTALARSLDARKEEEIVSLLSDADSRAPVEVSVFNVGANVNFLLLDTTERVFRKVWEMAGDGLLCWLPCRARGRAPDVAARSRQHLLHAWRYRVRGLRQR